MRNVHNKKIIGIICKDLGETIVLDFLETIENDNQVIFKGSCGEIACDSQCAVEIVTDEDIKRKYIEYIYEKLKENIDRFYRTEEIVSIELRVVNTESFHTSSFPIEEYDFFIGNDGGRMIVLKGENNEETINFDVYQRFYFEQNEEEFVIRLCNDIEIFTIIF